MIVILKVYTCKRMPTEPRTAVAKAGPPDLVRSLPFKHKPEHCQSVHASVSRVSHMIHMKR